MARPGGARAQPPSTRQTTSRTSFGRYSIDAASSSQTSFASHQRAQSQAPSVAAGSISSRYSTSSLRERDYYPTNPSVPVNPSEFVPTATYIERGQRWMEKEEAQSLRDAMEELDVRDAQKETTGDEERIFNAALDEAAELVWRHQNGVLPRPPDGPYRYRSHLRKDSYAHARTASLERASQDTTSNVQADDSISGRQSLSGSSSDSDELSCNNPPLSGAESSTVNSSGRPKSYGSINSQYVARRRSSMKRNISGEVQRPFSGDQIWEEPEDLPMGTNKDISVSNHEALDILGSKPPNSIERPLDYASKPHVNAKPLNKIEIYRNPPTKSRNAQYRVNAPLTPLPVEEERQKNGIEIRGDDIRAATSMKLKDRSPNLPEPTAVSDSPGRPIVSFDANWKAPEESTDNKPERPMPIPPPNGRYQPQQQPVGVPSIVVAEDGAPQSRSPTNTNVPSICVGDFDDNPKSSMPIINLPTISIDTPSDRKDIPAIVMPNDTPLKGPRPLPDPSSRGAQSRGSQRSHGHWSPAPGATSRASTACHECGEAIVGRFVALAGMRERFHPHCFSCFSCGTALEAMEISPEPEKIRIERLERIRRRAAGEVLEEQPGTTMGEDGDERLRFFCHLDWHEQFAPRCKHCTTPILGEHIVALGEHWHYGHFFCAECGDPFEHGMTHIEKDGYAWCINCQTKRTERRAPKCKMCKTAVIGQYIQALGGEWHEHCFRCAECKGSFDDGQVFPKEVPGGAVVLCTGCRARELKF